MGSQAPRLVRHQRVPWGSRGAHPRRGPPGLPGRKTFEPPEGQGQRPLGCLRAMPGREKGLGEALRGFGLPGAVRPCTGVCSTGHGGRPDPESDSSTMGAGRDPCARHRSGVPASNPPRVGSGGGNRIGPDHFHGCPRVSVVLPPSILFSSLLSSVASAMVDSVALFRAYSLLGTLSESPLLIGVGSLVFSLMSATALWVLYRNLVATPSAERRYARARV
jgi:hypothetical protein